MENNKLIIKKKDLLKEVLIDPETYTYNTGDQRNSTNDNEIGTTKTTDQLSAMVDEPPNKYNPQGYMGNYFFEEKVKEEKIFTKSQLIDELLSDNDTPDENVDSIVALLNDVDVDKIGEPKLFKITKKIFDKFNLKGLDGEYKTKLIDYLRKDDKVI